MERFTELEGGIQTSGLKHQWPMAPMSTLHNMHETPYSRHLGMVFEWCFMVCVAGPEAFDHDEQYLALMISFQSIIVPGSRACIQFFGEEGKGFQPGLKVGGISP